MVVERIAQRANMKYELPEWLKQGRFLAALLATVSLADSAGAAAAPERMSLEQGFQDPPQSARPRVWWHWMNGNITKEGIQADLEWMRRTGIAGFQNFDAALFTPQVVEKRLVFMSADWKDAFHFAIATADRLGLEAAIAGSPGWSESGGPWVSPEAAMKKVVWSETTIEGGKPFAGKLPQPPVNSGSFLDVSMGEGLGLATGNSPTLYHDTRVVAFLTPQPDVAPLSGRAHVTGSSGAIDSVALSDRSLSRWVTLPIAPAGQSSWIQFRFDHPESVRAVTFATADHPPLEQFMGGAPGPEIQASDDGSSWRTLAQIPNDGAAQHTIAFEAVTARFYRAVWPSTATAPAAMSAEMAELLNAMGIKPPAPSSDRHIAELRLEGGARVLRYEEKAGFGLLADLQSIPTPQADPIAAVSRDSVIDLTDRMTADGTLRWAPPSGHWTVLRFGYSLTGKTNHPASPEGTGLEVDKLSAEHVRDYMNRYLDMYQDATQGSMGKRGLQYVINDSWEAGTANWTEDLLAQFKARRGYDATPWLPVLTGRVLGSAASSDGFLWDYRQTLAELLAENHYDLITRLLHERGMGHYGESHEASRAFIGDGMEAKRSDDIPMSAMWTQSPGVNEDKPGYNADVRESASVAHIYGQNLVAAESLTAQAGAWRWSPATLKPTADKELAMGLNRFVIHTSVHQPLMDKGPGLGLGPFGQWFTRNETWSGAGAKAWIDYLARSSYLLQQGHFVADVAWYYGEDSNITALYGKAAPSIPEGVPFDYVNADVIRHKLKIIDGQIATDTGMRYRVLAMDPRAAQMSLPVLAALRDLIAAGAVVSGPKPTSSPSLADDNREYQAIVQEVWGDERVHTYGKGRVYSGMKLADVLAAEAIMPDFQYTKSSPDTQLLAVHRKLEDGDIYFIDNRSERAASVEVSLRLTGLVPELWHAETGRSEALSWRRAGSRTLIPLRLGPWEAVFVVMRTASEARFGHAPERTSEAVATLNGPWQVSFQRDRHAPASAELQLGSWSDNHDEGIKCFAGTGTYQRTIDVPAKWLGKGVQLWLDLGEVHELAKIIVNGQSLGVTWRPPYRLDIAPALRPGHNSLEIAVTDVWANRLICDAPPNAKDPFTFTSPNYYKGNESLVPAGLIGPVELQRSVTTR